MTKSSKTAAAIAAAPAAPVTPKQPPFGFSFIAAGHYAAPGGYELKRGESGEWLLTQKQGARNKKLGAYRTVYDGIRAGKDAAGIAYSLPEKTVLKAKMQTQDAGDEIPEAALLPVEDAADQEADVDL